MLHFGIDDAYHPVYRSEFRENLVQIIRLARKEFNPDIILLTSHPFDDQYDMSAVYIYYRALRELSAEMNCRLVPVHTWWAGYLLDTGLKSRDLLQKDTRYPNEHGHRVIAEAVINTIKL
jgi:lysophospholipase L1-like esterase